MQSEANLSQEQDDAWLYDDSISRDEANVCGCARLHDQAMAQDLALVSGSSTMYDNAIACDNAILTAGCIRNEAVVCGNARVRENAATHIAPVVTGQSVVMGDLSGSVVVYGRGFILPGQTVDNPTRPKPTLYLARSSSLNYPNTPAVTAGRSCTVTACA